MSVINWEAVKRLRSEYDDRVAINIVLKKKHDQAQKACADGRRVMERIQKDLHDALFPDGMVF